jgi:hypothetical protein
MHTFRSATLSVLLGLLLASGVVSFGATRALAEGYYHPADQQVYVTYCHVPQTGDMWQARSMAPVSCP